MTEFLPDPNAILSDIELDLGDHVAAGADHLGDPATDPEVGAPDLAPDATDLPPEPDPFLDPSQGVTETTAWAVAADIPLPDPFSAAVAGGGLLGAVSRRRARKAAERRERSDGSET